MHLDVMLIYGPKLLYWSINRPLGGKKVNSFFLFVLFFVPFPVQNT